MLLEPLFYALLHTSTTRNEDMVWLIEHLFYRTFVLFARWTAVLFFLRCSFGVLATLRLLNLSLRLLTCGFRIIEARLNKTENVCSMLHVRIVDASFLGMAG